MRNLFCLGCSVVLCVFVVSCGKGNPPVVPPYEQPPATNPIATVPPTGAMLKIGNIERKFSERDNTACSFNENEIKVEFLSLEQASGFIIELRGLNPERNPHVLRGKGVVNGVRQKIELTLGGNGLKNILSNDTLRVAGEVEPVATRCKFKIQLVGQQTLLVEHIECDDLFNEPKELQAQPMVGSFACQMPSPYRGARWQWQQQPITPITPAPGITPRPVNPTCPTCPQP